MKKLLRIMLTLATTTTIPFSVIACGQQDLDTTLNTIYKGETNYLISDSDLDTKIALSNTAVTTPFQLTTDVLQTLAQNLANTIMAKAKGPAINWYDKDKSVNTKCYNFNITNGTDIATGKQWDVNQITQRIAINISYLVGNADSAKNFKANQKIDMTFNIKVGTSASDTALKAWIDEFNNQNWINIATPIVVDLKDVKADLPKQNTSWSDLDKLIIAASNSAIQTAIDNVTTWDNKNVVAWDVKGVGALDGDNKMQLTLNVNFGDSQTGDGIAPGVNNFYIQFTKSS